MTLNRQMTDKNVTVVKVVRFFFLFVIFLYNFNNLLIKLNTHFGKLAKNLLCFSRLTSSVKREYVLLMQTLRRKFVSESFILSSLCAHNCNILLRSSRKRNFAEIIGTFGRLCRKGDERGGPNISESSSEAFSVVVGRVILFFYYFKILNFL